MQLRNNLYTVTEKKVDGLTGYFELALTPSCFIYQAHFPGEPITPGVCMAHPIYLGGNFLILQKIYTFVP